jgi:hypothetical protein
LRTAANAGDGTSEFVSEVEREGVALAATAFVPDDSGAAFVCAESETAMPQQESAAERAAVARAATRTRNRSWGLLNTLKILVENHPN